MSETKTLVINMKTGDAVSVYDMIFSVSLNDKIFNDWHLEKSWIRTVEIPENSTDWQYHKYTRVLFYVVNGRIRSMHIE